MKGNNQLPGEQQLGLFSNLINLAEKTLNYFKNIVLVLKPESLYNGDSFD